MEKLGFILKPLTPLLFRKPIPFRLGGYAPTFPLPSPSTIAGMIRSAILDYLADTRNMDVSQAFENRKDLLGEPSIYSEMSWTLIGPYLGKITDDSVEVYYPAPVDLLKMKDTYKPCYEYKKERELIPLYIIDVKKMYKELPLNELLRVGDENKSRKSYYSFLPLTFISGVEYESMLGKFVSKRVFERYLNNDVREIEGEEFIKEIKFEAYDGEDIIGSKTKYNPIMIRVYSGIMLRKDTKTLDLRLSEGKIKGMYYQFERVHLDKDWGFVFGIVTEDSDVAEDIKKALDGKILRLGGKGGLVECREIEIKLLEFENPKYISPNGRDGFKLILTAPAVLKGNVGSYPEEYSDILFGYASTKRIIGGWDYYYERPKPIHIGVNAGSVYYFDKPADFDVFLNRKYVEDEFKNVFGSALIGDL